MTDYRSLGCLEKTKCFCWRPNRSHQDAPYARILRRASWWYTAGCKQLNRRNTRGTRSMSVLHPWFQRLSHFCRMAALSTFLSAFCGLILTTIHLMTTRSRPHSYHSCRRVPHRYLSRYLMKKMNLFVSFCVCVVFSQIFIFQRQFQFLPSGTYLYFS